VAQHTIDRGEWLCQHHTYRMFDQLPLPLCLLDMYSRVQK
jgi:hypothetical protein